MHKTLSYKDVSLLPNCGIVTSRSECDVTQKLGSRTFALPVIPANMKCSISFGKAEWCQVNDIFYVLDRFYDYDRIIDWIILKNHAYVSISVGIKPEDFEFVLKLAKQKRVPEYITIDVAHGHSVQVFRMIEHIKKHLPCSFLIVGNITTRAAAIDLMMLDVDAIKVGIGQGHVCTTRLETGFGAPMFTSILECAEAKKERNHHAAIIADGGIYHFGDAAKAIVAGADFVMSGSMFARCIDSPAKTISVSLDGDTTKLYKEWYGSASEKNKGYNKYVEGRVTRELATFNSYDELIQKWEEALQSSVSYAGGNRLKDLQRVNYIIV